MNPLIKTFNDGIVKMEFAKLLSNLRLSINKDPCGYPCGSRLATLPGIIVGAQEHWTRTFSACVATPCSPPVLGAGTLSGGTFSFGVSGGAGRSWEVYAAGDVSQWQLVGQVTLDSSGNGTFSESGLGSINARFYRLSNGDCCSQAIGYTELGLQLSDGDRVQKLDLHGNVIGTLTYSGGNWSPSIPSFDVGEACYIIVGAQKHWTGTFFKCP